MTACLRCDGCSKAVAEHESDLRQWWRLVRHGMEWADEAGAPKFGPMMMAPPVFMHSTFIGGVFSDDEDEDDDDMMIVGIPIDDDEDADEPSSVVLHFCSARCLAGWAEQASAIEPDEESSE